jgi:hypothetical protein
VGRILCLLCIGLFSFAAQAETVRYSADLGSLPAAAPHRPGQPFWNAPHRLPDGRRALPLLVLLPPDADGPISIRLERRECTTGPLPTDDLRPRLRQLADGRALDGLQAPPGTVVQRFPLMHEGDALLQPLLLFADRDLLGPGLRERCERLDATVLFERRAAPLPERGHYLPDRLLRHVVNPGDRALWYVPYLKERESYDYLVIAREAFTTQSAQLPLFLAWKEELGHSTLVVTFEAIEAEMNAPGMERPELLRGWLQQHYQELGLKYVLLIGSPNAEKAEAIPMKQCWPAKEWEDPSYGLYDVPTDMYYADLTGNWNPDGDEYWCELEDYMELPEDGEAPPEDDRFDGVDLAPEVLLGRIPHFGKLPNYADGVLERTRYYGQTPPERWHNRTLLPAPQVCFPDGGYVDGSLVAKYLIDHSLAKNGLGHTTLAEWDGKLPSEYEGDDRLDMNSMPEYYNQGYGTVFWCAHGNQEVAVRNAWNSDANANGLPEQEECESDHFVNVLFHKAASDDFPAIIFQGSCLTADPAFDGNLTHSLLQHVSVTNVASTRLTMGLGDGDGWQPSPFSPGGFTLGVYFIHSTAVQLRPVGDAFHNAQSALGLGIQPWTFKTRLEFNLYGDPSLRLPGCDGDDDCDDGDACNGIESCFLGRCKAGIPLLCSPDKPMGICEEFGCDPVEGCLFRLKENHAPCDDGDPCTLDDFCYDGECVSVDPKTCPPPPATCWDSFCEPESGECLFVPLNDGSACTVDGTYGGCIDGTCHLDKPVDPPTETGTDVTAPADAVTETTAVEKESTIQPGGCALGGTAPAGTGMLVLLVMVMLAWTRARLSRRGTRPEAPGWSSSCS